MWNSIMCVLYSSVIICFSRISIDYSGLNESYKDFDEDEVKKYGDKLAKSISDASLTLQKIQAPNMKVMNLNQ